MFLIKYYKIHIAGPYMDKDILMHMHICILAHLYYLYKVTQAVDWQILNVLAIARCVIQRVLSGVSGDDLLTRSLWQIPQIPQPLQLWYDTSTFTCQWWPIGDCYSHVFERKVFSFLLETLSKGSWPEDYIWLCRTPGRAWKYNCVKL